MKRVLVLAAMLCLMSLCLEASGQSNEPASKPQKGTVTDQQTLDPVANRAHRPTLPMQDALKIAESYIDKQHIDISSYWLYRAIFILSGDEKTADKDKVPGWHFWWVNDSTALGDYVEIFVTMDGSASRAPSM